MANLTDDSLWTITQDVMCPSCTGKGFANPAKHTIVIDTRSPEFFEPRHCYTCNTTVYIDVSRSTDGRRVGFVSLKVQYFTGGAGNLTGSEVFLYAPEVKKTVVGGEASWEV